MKKSALNNAERCLALSSESLCNNDNKAVWQSGKTDCKETIRKTWIHYYDRDIVEGVAKKTNLSIAEISDNEKVLQQLLEDEISYFIWRQEWYRITFFDIQKNIIPGYCRQRGLYYSGQMCRCRPEEHKNCIRIYIYASEEQRLKNCRCTCARDPREAGRWSKWIRHGNLTIADMQDICQMMKIIRISW